MFRHIPAIVRFTPQRVLVFIGFMGLCNDGEISSSVVFLLLPLLRDVAGGGGVLCNLNTLSGVNLMMTGIARNM